MMNGESTTTTAEQRGETVALGAHPIGHQRYLTTLRRLAQGD